MESQVYHDADDALYSQVPINIRNYLSTNSDTNTLKSKDAVKYLLDGTLRFRVCRFCLNTTQNLSELDEIIVVAGKCGLYEVTIKDIMASFYPIKMTYDVNIPNKICNNCLEGALKCYLFTQQCEQSERALHNYFEEINEKYNKLDPIEPIKKRGKPKRYFNHNKLNIEFENVIDYAEPLINLVNLNGLLSDSQSDNLECPKCWHVLPNLTSLVNHEKSHPKSMWCHCKQCGKSFVKYTQLKKHKRQEHSDIIEEIKIDKIFTCKQCGISNNLLSKHLLHVEKHCFTKTLSDIIMNPKNNCVICFNKSNDMVNLNEVMYIHGGSPGLMGEKSISDMAMTVFPDISLHCQGNKICKQCLNKLITCYVFKLNVQNHRIRIDKCVSTMMETLKGVDENQHVLVEICDNLIIPMFNEDFDLKDGAEEFLEDEFRISESDSESDAKSTRSSSTDDIIIDNPARNATKTYAKKDLFNGFQQPIKTEIIYKNLDIERKKRYRNIQKYTCPLCYKHFISDYFLKKHVIRHVTKMTQCNICNEKFKSNFDYAEHMKTVHTLNIQTFSFCNICGRSLENVHKLKAHYKKHFHVQCQLCDKIFKTQAHLNWHMVKHQYKINLNRKNIETCSFCERDYSNENELSLHVNKVHLQIKPYGCDMCEKQFYTEHNLLSHKKLHSRKSREECSFCHKKFKCRKSLVVHVRKHINIKPHLCPICSKAFYSESSMKCHMKKLHGGRYCCRLCRHVVDSNSDLKNHFKVAHSYE